MVKIKVPVMVQDPAITAVKGMDPIERIELEDEFFLDGPISRNVAVLNFDPADGHLEPGAVFVPPEPDRVMGRYDVVEAVGDPLFQQVSAYATVKMAIELYERHDVLGRPVTWAFPGEQLLVIPRAGEWANAFYERDSRSLQFFSFDHDGQTVHTSLSRDIVGHETGHAILDGIAPDLYDAITPQSLALHEAIGDLTALLLALRSSKLRETVLEQTNGSIQGNTAFNWIAEQFGSARMGTRLRDFLNDHSLVDGDDLTRVSRTQPHELSTVVSGSLYPVLQLIHRQLTDQYLGEGLAPLAAAGKALGVGALRFGRVMLRALDYLPPGEVSFEDYARAVVASETISYPLETELRTLLMHEFTRRGVPVDQADVDRDLRIAAPELDETDRQTLIDSDWAAFDFVSRNRHLFEMPPDIPFRLRPRLRTRKTFFYGTTDEPVVVDELIFKVSWEEAEPNPLGPNFPPKRMLTVGTTLAIAWDEPEIRARLRHKLTPDQEQDRTDFLSEMISSGTLIPGKPVTSRFAPNRRVIGTESDEDQMRIRGTGMMLHVAGPWAPPVEAGDE